MFVMISFEMCTSTCFISMNLFLFVSRHLSHYLTFVLDSWPFCWIISSRIDMGDGIPDCSCGAGKMELRCAGKNAMHAGQYYLKCPANLNHAWSFQWCDMYVRGISSISGIDHREKSRLINERNTKCKVCRRIWQLWPSLYKEWPLWFEDPSLHRVYGHPLGCS